MAGSLIKIDEEIVTSAVASVTLGGIDWDSSYDVYVVKIVNLTTSAGILSLLARFLNTSNTEISSANYDRASKQLRTGGAFSNSSATNETYMNLFDFGNNNNEQLNAILYYFNMNNASEYSFYTIEQSRLDPYTELRGLQGGGVLTSAEATQGIKYYTNTGLTDFTGGKFTLYGLKK